MAAVSSYSNGRGGYSSRGTQNSGGSPWGFSTPVNAETAPTNMQRYAGNESSLHKQMQSEPTYPRTPDRTLKSSANGVHSQSNSAADINPSYLSPYKPGARPTLNGSRSGSEADSLIDLYGHPRSVGDCSVANSVSKDRIPPEDLHLDDEDPERSRWIHRDKLAIIESHEMQEAGIQLPQQQKRSASKSKPRREPVVGQDVPVVPVQEAALARSTGRDNGRPWSSIPQEDDDDEAVLNEFDFRSPEEIAADTAIDETSPNTYRQQDLRKSSSRIPLPRSSPMPIPQGHIERDTPLPRKRGASGNWTGEENGISYNRIRGRGNSVGSQVLLDDPDAAYNTPTPTSRPGSRASPTRSRITSDRPTPSHIRKSSITTNTPTSQPKSRQGSTTVSPRTPSTTQRPKSRSGLDPRPPTAINRPEGEAPWLATMYKPDPRLPPDQQILPTHAKRLQQQQEWDRAQKEDPARRKVDEKPPAQLPREFSPLAEHTVNGLQPTSREADEQALQDRGTEWPLPVGGAAQNHHQHPHKPISTAAPDMDTQHARYSPIPKPRTKQSVPDSPISQLHPSPQQQQQRVLDPFEKERLAREGGDAEKSAKEEGKKKEKGCGCCVIM